MAERGESSGETDESDEGDRVTWYERIAPEPADNSIPLGPPVDSDEVKRELRDPHPFTQRVGDDQEIMDTHSESGGWPIIDRFGWLPNRDEPYAGFTKDWFKDKKQIARMAGRVTFWTFVPHQKNAATRKILTFFLMVTWSTLTIGQSFGMAEVGEVYYVVTVVVFTIVSQIWGIELGAISAIATADTPETADTLRKEMPEEKFEYRENPPGRIPSNYRDERRRPKPRERPREQNPEDDTPQDYERKREPEKDRREE